MNDALHSLRFRNSKVLPQLGVELPLQALDDMRMGECFDYATLAVYVMRACGIPVALDFTPQWPDRAHNHYWNALIDNTGLCIPFVGVESNPGYPSKQGRLLAKVYRYTFAYQPQSLHALNAESHESVPPMLDSPFMKDVSGEYFKGRNAGIENASAMFKDYWSDVSGTVDAHNTIRISGSVSFTYHEFGYGYVDVKYNVTGYFDGTNGDITWRQQPNWW